MRCLASIAGISVLAVALVAIACASPTSRAPGACDGFEVLVAASDYTSSSVGAASSDGLANLAGGVDFGKDPALAFSRGRAFFVARDGDVIFELEARCGRPIAQFRTADAVHRGSSNPQDVAVAPDGALFVPRYNVPSLLVLEPGGAPRAQLDLSSFDGDGNPNASSARIVEVAGRAKAFVALERLDDHDQLKSKQPSFMLRIDVSTLAIEASIPLAGRNPFGLMVEHGGALFLAEPGNFDALDEPLAGIERFDTATSTTKLLVAESALGASVAEVAIAQGCGVAIVADNTPNVNRTSLVSFDPETGAVLTSASRALLGPTEGYDLQGLAWRGDKLFVGDRRASARGYPIHVFDRSGACDLRARADALFVSQKPVALRASP